MVCSFAALAKVVGQLTPGTAGLGILPRFGALGLARDGLPDGIHHRTPSRGVPNKRWGPRATWAGFRHLFMARIRASRYGCAAVSDLL